MDEGEKAWSKTQEGNRVERLRKYHQICAGIVTEQGRELLPFVTKEELSQCTNVAMVTLNEDMADPRFLVGTTLVVDGNKFHYMDAALNILKRKESITVDSLAREMRYTPDAITRWIETVTDGEEVLKRIGLYHLRPESSKLIEARRALYIRIIANLRRDGLEPNALSIFRACSREGSAVTGVTPDSIESFFVQLRISDPTQVESLGYVFGKNHY